MIKWYLLLWFKVTGFDAPVFHPDSFMVQLDSKAECEELFIEEVNALFPVINQGAYIEDVDHRCFKIWFAGPKDVPKKECKTISPEERCLRKSVQ